MGPNVDDFKNQLKTPMSYNVNLTQCPKVASHLGPNYW
jgi:hypothetical protein